MNPLTSHIFLSHQTRKQLTKGSELIKCFTIFSTDSLISLGKAYRPVMRLLVKVWSSNLSQMSKSMYWCISAWVRPGFRRKIPDSAMICCTCSSNVNIDPWIILALTASWKLWKRSEMSILMKMRRSLVADSGNSKEWTEWVSTVFELIPVLRSASVSASAEGCEILSVEELVLGTGISWMVERNGFGSVTGLQVCVVS